MDAISALGATGASTTGTPNGFSELTSEEFVKIIFTELQHQDPLQPNDTGALLEQLSTIRSIQSDVDFTTRLSALVTQNELASASGLIGRGVSGVSEDNVRVIGLVQSVTKTGDGAILNLQGGYRVRMSNVDNILGVE